MLMKDDVKERLYQHGPEVLTNAELIALILRKGKKNVSPLCVAESMASEDGLYRQLAACHSVDDLLYQYSVTQEQAQALLAAMELGRRMVLANTAEAKHITSPGDAAQYLMGQLRYETHECFVVLLLNTKNRIMRCQRVAEGSLSSAIVHPREVYAPAVTAHAASILVAHNHPSGDPYPSTEDRHLTLALSKAGDVLGIPLMDHVIIGDGRYYSFKEYEAL